MLPFALVRGTRPYGVDFPERRVCLVDPSADIRLALDISPDDFADRATEALGALF